jgi:hypothetical protein
MIWDKPNYKVNFFAASIVAVLGVYGCSHGGGAKQQAGQPQRSIAGSKGSEGSYSSEQAPQGAGVF